MWQRKVLWLLLVMLIAGTGWTLFLSDHGYFTYRKEREENLRLQQQIARLKAQREALAKEILRLRNDPDALEQLVHERLGFVHPDEYIILHPTESEIP